MYRFFGTIEVHIGDKFANKTDFFRIVAQTILDGQEKKAVVIFYTWHYSEERIKSILGDNVMVVEPKGFERWTQIFRNTFYEQNQTEYPLLK